MRGNIISWIFAIAIKQFTTCSCNHELQCGIHLDAFFLLYYETAISVTVNCPVKCFHMCECLTVYCGDVKSYTWKVHNNFAVANFFDVA